jgi:hypothetical protein
MEPVSGTKIKQTYVAGAVTEVTRKLLQSLRAVDTWAGPLAVPVTARRQLSALQAALSVSDAKEIGRQYRTRASGTIILKKWGNERI